MSVESTDSGRSIFHIMYESYRNMLAKEAAKEQGQHSYIKSLDWKDGEYDKFDDRVRGIHHRLSIYQMRKK